MKRFPNYRPSLMNTENELCVVPLVRGKRRRGNEIMCSQRCDGFCTCIACCCSARCVELFCQIISKHCRNLWRFLLCGFDCMDGFIEGKASRETKPASASNLFGCHRHNTLCFLLISRCRSSGSCSSTRCVVVLRTRVQHVNLALNRAVQLSPLRFVLMQRKRHETRKNLLSA